MGARRESSDVSDSVSFQTETSTSGRSTIVSEINSTVVDQPNGHSKVTEENITVKTNKPGCCFECECYCDCNRDCTDNCCCRCMQNVSCCVINFFYYFLLFLKYIIIFPFYIIILCLIFLLPPLWFRCLICHEESSGNLCTELGVIWRKINSKFLWWNFHFSYNQMAATTPPFKLDLLLRQHWSFDNKTILIFLIFLFVPFEYITVSPTSV